MGTIDASIDEAVGQTIATQVISPIDMTIRLQMPNFRWGKDSTVQETY